jgi:hypothetical protein
MTRFMLAHLQMGRVDDATILRPDTVQLMHSPSEEALPGFATMAHGFFHETRNGRTFIGHGGDTVYFHTDLGLLPDEGVGIFCSFNSRGRNEAVYGLRKALVDDFLNRYFPATQTSQKFTPLASAASDAHKIAGRYESSRRVEHGFLSVFYLLQQESIGANEDGTVEAPKAFEPGTVRFQEGAPNVWREIGGTRQLALATVNGVKTVVDSENPTAVLQEVPGHRSAPLNLTILLGSALIAIATVVLWPILYLIRRHYGRVLGLRPEAQRPRLILRLAACFAVLWLVCWIVVLTPVLNTQLDFYSAATDPIILSLEIAGLVLLALTVLALWSFWRLCRVETSWLARLGNGAIVAMLLGFSWIGWIGGLIGVNLNY